MLRIGFVDLDTSHAESFARVIETMGDARLAAMLDHGDVVGEETVEAFCRAHNCRRCRSAQEMIENADAVAVLSVNWDAHLERARPYMEAGLPTFVDKPVAGRLRDVLAFRDLATKTRTPLFEGSGYRWNEPMAQARQRFAAAKLDTFFASAPNEFFYYGVHAVEAALGLLGPGIESVWTLRNDEQGTVVQFHHAGRNANGYLMLQAPFTLREATFVAEGFPQRVEFTAAQIHQGVMGAFVRMAREKRSPLEPQHAGEAVNVLLAATASASSGATVAVADFHESVAFNGAAFAKAYKAARQARSVKTQ